MTMKPLSVRFSRLTPISESDSRQFFTNFMGLYSDYIFPMIMDRAMSRPAFTEQRKLALASAHGEVLEIGFGTGLNFPHYPPGVTRLDAVEPGKFRSRIVLKRAPIALKIELLCGRAEMLPYQNGRFDCVLSTWTLCTIVDVGAALAEIRRVLKPNGIFIFLEHGRSENPVIAKWQNRLNRLQRMFACGCNLNRSINSLISQAGFTINSLERYYMPSVPRVAGAMYRGIAVPNNE